MPTGSGVALRGLRPGQGIDYVAADISPTMLGRARAAATRLGVADQVTTVPADVGALPFADASFDLVISLTGIALLPRPAPCHRRDGARAAPGAALTGSSLFTDTGPRYELLRRVGTRAGILGPMCTSTEAVTWLRESGCRDVDLTLHGGLGYFHATTEEDRG